MSSVAFVGAWALGSAACEMDSNDHGKFAAQGTGDVSHPPLERTGALLTQRLLCPPPEGATYAAFDSTLGAKALRRTPYLQQVTDSSAAVVWTAVPNGKPPQVVVSDAQGRVVARAAAEPDDSVPVLRGGARQLVARVQGLAAGATYCYQIEQGKGRVFGPEPLRTAPPRGTGPVRFVVIGDSGGGGEDQEMVTRQLSTVPADLMLHTGDIAYDAGTQDDFERTFFTPYRSLLKSLPVFPIAGNHDYYTDDAAPYRASFVLPENGGAEGRERWFSFDWGQVHFVGLDTEKIGPAQQEWLERDLAANDLPWTIVYGHTPPYSSGDHGSDMEFRKWFGPAIERHHVALVLSGHDHHYERARPQNGVTYIVTGGGGRGTRPVSGGSFTAYAESVLSFLQVTVDDDQLAVHAIDAMGREFDGTVIRRHAEGGSATPETAVAAP